MRIAPALAVLAVLTLAGCGNDDEPKADPKPTNVQSSSASVEPSPTESESVPTETVAAAPAGCDHFDFSALTDFSGRSVSDLQVAEAGGFMDCRMYFSHEGKAAVEAWMTTEGGYASGVSWSELEWSVTEVSDPTARLTDGDLTGYRRSKVNGVEIYTAPANEMSKVAPTEVFGMAEIGPAEIRVLVRSAKSGRTEEALRAVEAFLSAAARG